MKRRILFALMGLALIASLSLPSITSPREANALPTVWPDACTVYGLHMKEAYSEGDWWYLEIVVQQARGANCLV
jgi:hypothetical protein